jgi:hypothetical protein
MGDSDGGECVDSDDCCACDKCAPYRLKILATIQYLDALIAGQPVCMAPCTPFDSNFAPLIPMTVYVQRFVHHHRHFEWPVLIVALVYIARIQSIDETHMLTKYNVHRMVCTAFVMAYKYTVDFVHSNKTMALLGGIDDVQELNRLERYTLQAIEWNLHVSEQEYESMCSEVCVMKYV